MIDAGFFIQNAAALLFLCILGLFWLHVGVTQNSPVHIGAFFLTLCVILRVTWRFL